MHTDMARVANSEDYLRVSTTLQLPPNTGDTAVAFTIEASSDSRIEGEETFFLLLSEPSEGARLGRSNATVIIEGNFRQSKCQESGATPLSISTV